jgi:hypothetical protein
MGAEISSQAADEAKNLRAETREKAKVFFRKKKLQEMRDEANAIMHLHNLRTAYNVPGVRITRRTIKDLGWLERRQRARGEYCVVDGECTFTSGMNNLKQNLKEGRPCFNDQKKCEKFLDELDQVILQDVKAEQAEIAKQVEKEEELLLGAPAAAAAAPIAMEAVAVTEAAAVSVVGAVGAAATNAAKAVASSDVKFGGGHKHKQTPTVCLINNQF